MTINSKYKAHKFGGSSLADAVKIRNVVTLLKYKDEITIVSAIGKTTNKLQTALNLAKAQQDFQPQVEKICKYHIEIIEELFSNSLDDMSKSNLLIDEIKQDTQNISQILRTVSLTKTYADNIRYFILGYGELWSAKILTEYSASLGNDVGFIDASKILYIDEKTSPVTINWNRSEQKLIKMIKQNPHKSYIITGFIASNEEGNRTILGLNCSDYSAAIFTILFNATELNIWTDVAGIYSANPLKVPEAVSLKRLSYKEALELAYFGASVVHPLTISPMMQKNIPIYVKSSFNSSAQGTVINAATSQPTRIVKGLTSVNDIALLRIQGAGMIGVSGIAAKVFSTLERHEISVVMISQASSEYSICFAITMPQLEIAVNVLEKEFNHEITNGYVEHIRYDENLSLVTAVGDGMIGNPGTSGTILETLAKSYINIHAIAQGSSERSITVAIKQGDEDKALQSIHAAYYSNHKTVAIAIIGVGNVGSVILQQLAKQQQKLFQQKNIKLKLIGIMNSKEMLLSQEDLLSVNWQKRFKKSSINADLTRFTEHLESASEQEKIMLDSTANSSIANSYLSILESGIHVITPNKHANTQSISYYQELRGQAKKHQVKYLYETNVCAGLPIIKTIQDLINTGDDITSISGVFSGTLSFIFTELNKGKNFSEAVKNAFELGYTEPDPREDLSGMDVARKVICLAREIGLEAELSNLVVEDLTPQALRECSINEFFASLEQYDARMADLFAEKLQNKLGLHYVGTINSNGDISVGIESYGSDSPFANTEGTDNIIIIHSDRYKERPMVIQGPGAGAEVTAAGVFADIMQAIS